MNGTRLQRNRLYELFDDAPTTTGDDIVAPTGTFDNSTAGVNANNNYRYDALGNLIRDERAEIHAIDWTVAGKVRGVERTLGSTLKPLQFAYGASGQRIMKQVGQPGTDAGAYREHYIRDAQGNIMATYRYSNSGSASLKLNERPLYGSSRLGSLHKEEELHSLPSFDPEGANPVQLIDLNYELTDHLGNVCAVVTGRLLDGNGGGTPKQAELVSAQGYEAFGQILSGRNYSSGSYRFGFNGQEMDNEIYGAEGTSNTAEFWQYDTRLGRRWNIDPLTQAFQSPFACFNNSPLWLNDPLGLSAGGDDEPVRQGDPICDENDNILGYASTSEYEVIALSSSSKSNLSSFLSSAAQKIRQFERMLQGNQRTRSWGVVITSDKYTADNDNTAPKLERGGKYIEIPYEIIELIDLMATLASARSLVQPMREVPRGLQDYNRTTRFMNGKGIPKSERSKFFQDLKRVNEEYNIGLRNEQLSVLQDFALSAAVQEAANRYHSRTERPSVVNEMPQVQNTVAHDSARCVFNGNGYSIWRTYWSNGTTTDTQVPDSTLIEP